MDIRISGRHIDVTDAIRDHVESGFEKLENHFGRAIDADVVLDVDNRGQRQMVEINLHANGLRVNAKEVSEDLYRAFDSALSKVDKQVAKFKDRIQRHKPRTAREARSYGHRVIRLAMEEGGAAATMPSNDGPSNDGLHHLIHHEQLDMRPMTVEEAAFQLDLTEENFVVFANAETEALNVIYSRGDGTYGLIEPPS